MTVYVYSKLVQSAETWNMHNHLEERIIVIEMYCNLLKPQNELPQKNWACIKRINDTYQNDNQTRSNRKYSIISSNIIKLSSVLKTYMGSYASPHLTFSNQGCSCVDNFPCHDKWLPWIFSHCDPLSLFSYILPTVKICFRFFSSYYECQKNVNCLFLMFMISFLCLIASFKIFRLLIAVCQSIITSL